MATTKEVVLDDRRRTSLARIGHKDHDKYLAQEYEDGTIVLTPALTISHVELAMLQSPEVIAALEQAAEGDRTKLRRRPPPQRRP